jgi:hypothetical protein
MSDRKKDIKSNVVEAPVKKRLDITNMRRVYATQNAQMGRLNAPD